MSEFSPNFSKSKTDLVSTSKSLESANFKLNSTKENPKIDFTDNSNTEKTEIGHRPSLKTRLANQFSNFDIPYNIFLWLALIGFNLTFSVNWWQAIFYLTTSGFLALILGNVILRRFSVKVLEYLILAVFVFANLILTFFKQFELFFALYYLTYCLIFVRLFISFRNRLGTTRVWERMTKRSLRAVVCFGLLITLPFSYFFITDPFSGGSTITKPYSQYLQNGQIGLTKNQSLRAFNNPFSKALGYVKSGGHIFGANFVKEVGFESKNLEEIINQTHELRFGPNIPYIISGGHFSVFYPRSLGIFYHATMDPNLNQNQQDWQNRQAAYLKTLAFALDSFQECGRLYTTIVPLGENSITCIQIYHYPSDSLYSVLFALQQLLDNSQYLKTFYPAGKVSQIEAPASGQTNSAQSAPSSVDSKVTNFDSQVLNVNSPDSTGDFNLQTQTYTKVLLENNRELLTKLWQNYQDLAWDPTTGLVKLGVELSGTKDIGLQDGSFYDNVVFWRTWQLAQSLGLAKVDQSGLQTLKERILTTFWNNSLGIFAEDQSPECARSCYSSDWLIILLTGFLKPQDPVERTFYQRSVQYVIDNKIDQPFPLRYHNDDRPDKTHPLVRLTNHEYAGTAIWSYWGLEYVKTLYLLANSTDLADSSDNQITANQESGKSSSSNLTPAPANTDPGQIPNYRQLADTFLDQYAQNIVKYGGFPEVYDSKGLIMEANLYRSVVKTGWVVNWEQARAMGKK